MSDYDESDVLFSEIGMLALRIDTPSYLRLKAAAEAVTKQLATAHREVERMRAVYLAAVALSSLRAQAMKLGDMNYDQMDGQIVDAMDAIDTAITAKENGE